MSLMKVVVRRGDEVEVFTTKAATTVKGLCGHFANGGGDLIAIHNNAVAKADEVLVAGEEYALVPKADKVGS